MPILVDADQANLTNLQHAMPAGSHAVGGLDRMFAWLDQHSDEYVVALGPSLPLDHVTTVAEELRIKRPTVSVVLVRDHLDTQILTRAMQSGIRDVVTTDDDKGLAKAVERAVGQPAFAP